MPKLRLTSHVVISNDSSNNNNPLRRPVDWERSVSSISVNKPANHNYILAPQEEVVAFSGTRSIAHASNTEYALTVSALSSTRYRLKHTGTGTAPAFRTPRSVAVAGGTVTITVNSNQTITVVSSLGAVFGAVQVGDILHVPGVATGDTGPFDPLNEGNWVILSASTTTLTAVRPSGTVFSGSTETVSVSSGQFKVFSSVAVQVGDYVDISGGFAASTRHSYPIVAVTDDYIEFTSTIPLATETAVPGASGLAIYTNLKRLVIVESDQEIAVKLNGNSSETDISTPWVAGDDRFCAQFLKIGPSFSCTVKNRSTVSASVTVITAE
jgi:hypothetical protein